MAFWVISSQQDPSYTNAQEISGPIFGMRSDFNGFGVIIDVYDNDNRRNNPSVYVLANLDGKKSTWNHDDDFSSDLYTKVPEDEDPNSPKSFRCVVDVRNSGKPARLLVKLLRNILHVYADTADGAGFKFCLAVEFPRTFEDYHIAFTAATGQVADNHDIIDVTTKYLQDADQVDDSALSQLGAGGGISSIRSACYLVIFLAGAYLTLQSGYCASTFHSMSASQLDPVKICDAINRFLLPQFIAHFSILVLLIIAGHWILALVNLPLAAWEGFSLFTDTHLFLPTHPSYTGKRKMGLNSLLRNFPRLLIFFLFNAIMSVFYIWLIL